MDRHLDCCQVFTIIFNMVLSITISLCVFCVVTEVGSIPECGIARSELIYIKMFICGQNTLQKLSQFIPLPAGFPVPVLY